ADLGAQEAMWVVQGDVTSLTTDDLAAFTLDAAGLTFHFSPYAMGPYVQGSFRVTLPFEALAGLAADDGPVAAFARGAPVAAPGLRGTSAGAAARRAGARTRPRGAAARRPRAER